MVKAVVLAFIVLIVSIRLCFFFKFSIMFL